MAWDRAQWEMKLKLIQDIIVKANDGRGMGHISRVLQWIVHPSIRNRIHVFAAERYKKSLPEGISAATIINDEGIRVGLDKKEAYVKFGEINRWRNREDEKLAACARYYSAFHNCLNPDINLVYIDDQNSPETLFLPEVAEVLGNGIHFGDISEKAPYARIVVEMETQEAERDSTMHRALERAHYIHLSSSKEFLGIATNHHFGEEWGYKSLEQKVLEMGFLLSDRVKKNIDDVLSDKEKIRRNIFDEFKSGCKNYVYSSFGAADGADEIYDSLISAAEKRKDTLFVIANMKKIKDIIAKKWELSAVGEKGGRETKWMIKGLDNFYIVENEDTSEHITRFAAADICVLGCGSSTIYEGVYTGNPLICLPLQRPGYEQIIKATGIVNCRAGEAFFNAPLMNDYKTQEYLKRIEFSPESLTPERLAGKIDDIAKKISYYADGNSKLRRYFKTEEEVAKQMLDIANSNKFNR
jgi:hypothetical protein